MKYLIDSYAWLEYFMGTSRGRRVKEVVEGVAAECVVSAINLAEVYAKSIKTDGVEKAGERKLFIVSRCAVIAVDDPIATQAAKLDVQMKSKIRGWGLADSIILATARLVNATILTGDEHFKGLENVEML